MLELIHCTNCKKSGNFKLKLTYTYNVNTCGECRQIHKSKLDYWFCDIQCQQQWIDDWEIMELGFPCDRCGGTGYRFGYQSNGICDECSGSRRV